MMALRIGVIGYGRDVAFDESAALGLVRRAFDAIEGSVPGETLDVIADLNGDGVAGIALHEAKARGYGTTGIGCELARHRSIYPCKRGILVASEDVDAVRARFLDSIDVLVRVGGGAPRRWDAAEAQARGIKAMEYELPSLQVL